jgi:hypothetical protein
VCERAGDREKEKRRERKIWSCIGMNSRKNQDSGYHQEHPGREAEILECVMFENRYDNCNYVAHLQMRRPRNEVTRAADMYSQQMHAQTMLSAKTYLVIGKATGVQSAYLCASCRRAGTHDTIIRYHKSYAKFELPRQPEGEW